MSTHASYRFIMVSMLLLLGTSTSILAARPENPNNGQMHIAKTGAEVWDAGGGQWVRPETFWLNFANHSTGKFWGRQTDYPPYREVSEHDTLLIELEQGPCLMEFFHSRWRRAEDVRRWDPAFNEYGGCPTVFD